MTRNPEVVALAEAEGLTYSGAWKRLNRDAAREYNRRDWLRPGRAHQKTRSEATAGAAACADCGKVRAGAKWDAYERCDECERESRKRARRARCQEIERLWNEGLSLREIAERLDSTVSSIGGTLTRMRDEGWNVPLRHHGKFAERRAA